MLRHLRKHVIDTLPDRRQVDKSVPSVCIRKNAGQNAEHILHANGDKVCPDLRIIIVRKAIRFSDRMLFHDKMYGCPLLVYRFWADRPGLSIPLCFITQEDRAYHRPLPDIHTVFAHKHLWIGMDPDCRSDRTACISIVIHLKPGFLYISQISYIRSILFCKSR